jgi:hypothetical protein
LTWLDTCRLKLTKCRLKRLPIGDTWRFGIKAVRSHVLPILLNVRIDLSVRIRLIPNSNTFRYIGAWKRKVQTLAIITVVEAELINSIS